VGLTLIGALGHHNCYGITPAYQLTNYVTWRYSLQGGGTPIYLVLQSLSLVKVKVKSQAKNLQLAKGQTRFVIVYHDKYFQNISVNVKL